MYTMTTHSPHARLRSLPSGAFTLADGFWRAYQHTNRAVSIRQGYDKLEKAGNFNNFRKFLINLGGIPYADHIEEIVIQGKPDAKEYRLKLWVAIG